MKIVIRIVIACYIVILTVFQGLYIYYGGKPTLFWLSVLLEILSVLSLLGSGAGISHFLSVRCIVKNGISTKAVIKDHHVEWSKTKNYYPIIHFLDNSKISHKYQSKVGMTILLRKYRKGSKVKISYLENEPWEFVIVPAYYYQSIMEMIMFTFLGLPAVIGSFILVKC